VYVQWGVFWKPYIGQAVGGEFDMVVLTGGAEELYPPANQYRIVGLQARFETASSTVRKQEC
jgi:hypothetical protein